MKNAIANGDMKNEESTFHHVGGKRCGDIVRVDISRLEEIMGHRVYTCTGCKAKWKFGL
jgi:hypothetical protein